MDIRQEHFSFAAGADAARLFPEGLPSQADKPRFFRETAVRMA